MIFLHEPTQEIEDLRLDRRVERCRWLVGDHETRPAGDSHRDQHALPHAAAELERMGPGHMAGLGNADMVEQLVDARAHGTRREPLMLDQHIAELRANGEQWIERRQRLLEHHREGRTAQLPQLFRALAAQVFALKHDLTVHDSRRARHQPQNGVGGHRLAAAALTDQADDLARIDAEVDSVDRSQDPVARRDMGAKTADHQQCHTGLRACAGRDRSRRAFRRR